MFCGGLRTGHFNTLRAAAKSFLQSEDLAVGRLLNPSSAFLVSLHNHRQFSNCNHQQRKQQAFCCCLNRQRSVSSIRPMTSSAKKANRLALEKSPYLLQHATNPVDWYPWGQEAFEEAKKQDKLIFLSVGYSTCHWCHVMEHESFENEEIAKIMNEHFINVKVDREERPDVDKVYMTFVQASSGRGGWPMSVFLTPSLTPIAGGTYFPPKNTFGRPGFVTVLKSLADQGIAGNGGWPMSTWLTPDLKPVHGGTYYPPDDRYFGQPGFKSLLLLISDQWKVDRQKFYDSGSKILEVLKRHSKLEPSDVDGAPHIANESWKTCLTQLSARFEPQFGGFSESPKFPQPSNFNFLFHIYSRNPQSEEGKTALHMCLHSLTMKAKGGLHDHISQGFARYSTDEKWHVPHFEKMLYDQGQLLVSYSQAYVATKDDFYKEIIHDIFTYVNRDLSHKSGGFFSAEDADSLPDFDSAKKKEGAFCVWTHEEVNSLLGSKLIKDSSPMTLADLACYHFDIKLSGNVNPYQDPHDELKNQNVLIVTGSEIETAEKFGISLKETKQALKQIQQILHLARQKRPRPHLDDKMVAAWNGLMISGLSKAYEAVCDEAILERAEKAAFFLKEHMYNEQTGSILRCCYQEDGSVTQINEPISGFADDYAFVIRGLLDLYEACGNVAWLEWANDLQQKQDELFWDSQDSGYFSMAQDPNILLRLKEGQDGAEPTCNSVSASNLIRLAGMLDRPELEEKAGKLFLVFKQRLEKIPSALPEMSSSLLLFQDSCTQVVVTGDPRSKAAQILLAEIRSWLIPGRMLGYADGNSDSILYKSNESMKKMKVPKDGTSSVYLCHNHTCSLPVSQPKQLRSLLEERIGVK